jgi:NADPH2:quinone reductase
MRAVLVHEFGSLDRTGIQETADPVPAAGEVLVEIHAAPVNYVDLVTFRGEYQFRPSLPYIPGKGPSGVIRQVGEGVTDLQPGDRVLAMAEYGGYAELAAVDRRQVYPLPEMVSFVDAAAMALAFDTAWMSLRERARLQPGESVLVLGATGAVGGAAVALAKAMGASQVLAGVSSPDRFAGPAALGADTCIDLSLPDLKDSVREQVWAATGDRGVDVVIDTLGGDPFDGAVRSLAWRGRLVVVGFAAGRIPTLKVNYLLLKNIEISGVQISDYRKRTPELLTECYREVFSFVEQGKVPPLPSVTFPLDEWRAAMEVVASGTANHRVVLVPRP